MIKARGMAITLSCIVAVITGIVLGPMLQCMTYNIADALLPHPNGNGYDDFAFRGIQGAFVMIGPATCGAIWTPFFAVPWALSFFYPPRISARLLLLSALGFPVLGLSAVCLIFPLLYGPSAIHTVLERFEARHVLLMYFGYPLVWMAALILRSELLRRASNRIVLPDTGEEGVRQIRRVF